MVFDPERILRSLSEAGVEYVLIGGLANNLHGYDRATGDVDVCYAQDRDNVQRLVMVLQAVEARPRGWTDGVPFILDAQTVLNGDSFTFSTTAGDFDVMGTPSGTTGYRDLLPAAERMQIDDSLVIIVAGLGDLIRMKTAAARPKDMADIPELEALRELRAAEGGSSGASFDA